jgi:hypothetical protein
VEARYDGPTKRLVVLAGRTRAPRAVLREYRTWETYGALEATGGVVAAASLAIGVWERGTWRAAAELSEHENGVRELRFGADGGLLASVAADRRVALWDTADWTKTRSWQAHDDDVWGVDLHPRLPLVATASWDGTAKVWTLEGELVASAPVEGGGDGLAFAPAGDRLVVAGRGDPSPALLVFELEDA